MKRMRNFLHRHKQVVLYLSFGTITTFCSLLACFLTLRWGVRIWHNEAGEPTLMLDVIASTAQWIVGVIVAFWTSKKFVFVDAEQGTRVVLRQIEIFAASRIMTYLLEVGVNLLVIVLLEQGGYQTRMLWGIPLTERVLAKAASSLMMLFTNYWVSKLWVFRVKEKGKKRDEKRLRRRKNKGKEEKDSKRY